MTKADRILFDHAELGQCVRIHTLEDQDGISLCIEGSPEGLKVLARLIVATAEQKGNLGEGETQLIKTHGSGFMLSPDSVDGVRIQTVDPESFDPRGVARSWASQKN